MMEYLNVAAIIVAGLMVGGENQARRTSVDFSRLEIFL
jgi:hypothetical protein